MTIKKLLNACNAHPDVFIQIFDAEESPNQLVYEGKYEDLHEHHLSARVSYFSVEETKYTYRTYITKMKVFTVGDDRWTPFDQ